VKGISPTIAVCVCVWVGVCIGGLLGLLPFLGRIQYFFHFHRYNTYIFTSVLYFHKNVVLHFHLDRQEHFVTFSLRSNQPTTSGFRIFLSKNTFHRREIKRERDRDRERER